MGKNGILQGMTCLLSMTIKPFRNDHRSKTHENLNNCNKCSILKAHLSIYGFMDTCSL
jgi:hypothetical protein